MFNYVFVFFPCGILGQVWYLIVPIPYLYATLLGLRIDCVKFLDRLLKNVEAMAPRSQTYEKMVFEQDCMG